MQMFLMKIPKNRYHLTVSNLWIEDLEEKVDVPQLSFEANRQLERWWMVRSRQTTENWSLSSLDHFKLCGLDARRYESIHLWIKIPTEQGLERNLVGIKMKNPNKGVDEIHTWRDIKGNKKQLYKYSSKRKRLLYSLRKKWNVMDDAKRLMNISFFSPQSLL